MPSIELTALPQQRDVVAGSTGVEPSLVLAADKLDRILTLRGLSARITIEDKSFLVGGPSSDEAAAEFVFSTIRAYQNVVPNINLYLVAKAYFDGNLAFKGSMRNACDVLYAINLATDSRQTLAERTAQAMFRFGKAALPMFARKFESDSHYSIRADAYALFLDQYLQYTCAKFNSPSDSLDAAQTNKFHLIAGLVRDHIGDLKGIAHLDIGCGWGGLTSFFERYFETLSVGITNSNAQAEFARARFGSKIILGDFIDLGFRPERYDLVTIVGMAEHLTPRRRTKLFAILEQIVRPNGLVYFQCIAKPDIWIGGDAYRIAYEDVFPGHQLESGADMEERFRRSGFDVLYYADDTPDYARTTALWADRIESNKDRLVEMIGERNYRVFLGYLSYASKLFEHSRGSLKRYMLTRRQRK